MSLALSVLAFSHLPSLSQSDVGLAKPKLLVVESDLPSAQADAQILAARRYDTFWSTGDAALAEAALAPDFMDRTLPPGRPQGVAGSLAASRIVHAAIPDIRCEIEQLLVVSDRVVVHLHFGGHFTGHFAETQGQGQPIDFIATDIY
jgi:predicted ester cyclase